MLDNKFQVTITFPTEELLEEFCGYMSDGGGEQSYFFETYNLGCDYKRCFAPWGWKKGESKFIDVFIYDEEIAE